MAFAGKLSRAVIIYQQLADVQTSWLGMMKQVLVVEG